MRRIYFDGTLVRMGIQAVQIYIDCERQGAVWTAVWVLPAVECAHFFAHRYV